MRLFSFTILVGFLISACSKNSNSGNSQPPQTPPLVKSKIEPGNSFSLLCLDSFNKTTVSLVSVWVATNMQWTVYLEETDGSGNQVFELNNLAGFPDKVESLHMDIEDNLGSYAKVIQINESQAQYTDSNRVLSCSFQ